MRSGSFQVQRSFTLGSGRVPSCPTPAIRGSSGDRPGWGGLLTFAKLVTNGCLRHSGHTNVNAAPTCQKGWPRPIL